jgi:hypothetical protein
MKAADRITAQQQAQERRAQVQFGTRMLNQTVAILHIKAKRQPRGN